MTMLEDLRETVRRMDEFDKSKYPSTSNTHRAFCYASADFIRTHAAQIEQDVRDAERYRWLKVNATEITGEYGEAAQLYYGTYRRGPLELDASIDAAMAKESGNG